MRLLLFGMFLNVFGALANAQSFPVRSGEHETFTRLVFQLPERVDFDLTTQDQQATLSFEISNWNPDLSNVFNRIPRTRLQDVQFINEKNEMRLFLSCECDLTAFWYQDGLFVLDIKDKTQSAKTIKATTSEISSAQRPKSSHESGLRVTWVPTKTKENSLATRMLMQSIASRLKATERQYESTRVSHLFPHGRQMTAEVVKKEIKENPPSETLELNANKSNSRKENLNDVDWRAKVEIKTNSLPSQLAIRSRRNDIKQSVETEKAKAPSDHCIKDQEFDFLVMDQEAVNFQSLGIVRSSLFDERDNLNHVQAYKLASLYLYHGFGAEAHAALSFLNPDAKEIKLLYVVSEILEESYSSNDSLNDQIHCSGRASFWAIFHGEQLVPTKAPNDAAILRAFAELPRDIRRYLGPIASRRLLDAGFADLSDSLLRMVNSTEEKGSTDTGLINVELKRYYDSHEAPENAYEQVIENNRTPSNQAIIERIDVAILRNQEVSPDLAELTGAIAFEQSDQSDGPMLLAAYITALGASGQFDRAYQTLNSQDLIQTDAELLLRSRLASLLVDRASEMTVLTRFFANDLGPTHVLDEQTAISIAKLLKKNGFLNEALDTLNREFSTPYNRGARVLRARIYLEQNLPEQSEAQLIGLSGVDVDQLQSQAKGQRANNSQVSEFLQSSTSPDFSLSALQWEEWDAGSQVDASERSAEQTGVEQTLTQKLDLLSSATDTRIRLADILEANPMPAE